VLRYGQPRIPDMGRPPFCAAIGQVARGETPSWRRFRSVEASDSSCRCRRAPAALSRLGRRIRPPRCAVSRSRSCPGGAAWPSTAGPCPTMGCHASPVTSTPRLLIRGRCHRTASITQVEVPAPLQPRGGERPRPTSDVTVVRGGRAVATCPLRHRPGSRCALTLPTSRMSRRPMGTEGSESRS
jgi:hypothetical protein